MPRALERGLFRAALIALAVTAVLLAQRELSRNGSEADVLGVSSGPGALVLSGLGEGAIGVVAEAEGRFAVLEPRSGATVNDWKVDIEGVAPANTVVRSGATSVDVDDDGKWVLPVILFRGQNELDFKNVSTGADISMVLTFDPDAPDDGDDGEESETDDGSTTETPSSGTTSAERVDSGVEIAVGTTAPKAPSSTKAKNPKKNATPNKKKPNANRQPAANTTTTAATTSRVAVSRSDTPVPPPTAPPTASPTTPPTAAPATTAAPQAAPKANAKPAPAAKAKKPATPSRPTPVTPAAPGQTRTASPR